MMGSGSAGVRGSRGRNYDQWDRRSMTQYIPAGDPPVTDGEPPERRQRAERRHRIGWSILYGSFKPRRRSPPRRDDESRFHALDWHSPHLMAVAVCILLLCVGDAFLTLILLAGGAEEANPFMAPLVGGSVTVFTSLKMAMTGASVTFMVILARYRFMRVVRVELALYVVLLAYATLVGYELWMLKSHGGSGM
jgi:hypothetical protein